MVQPLAYGCKQKCYENEIYGQAKDKIPPCIACYDNCLCNSCNTNTGGN